MARINIDEIYTEGNVGTTIKSRDKGGAIFDVMAYGAVGDGIADDTAAFVAAFADSNKIFVPAGIFKVEDLNINSRTIVGAGRGTTILQGSGDVLIEAEYSRLSNFTLRNWGIRGKLISLNAIGGATGRAAFHNMEFGTAAYHVYAPRTCVDWSFSDCRFNDANVASLWFDETWALTLSECYSWYNKIGFRTTGGTTVKFMGCVFEYNTEQAIYLTDESPSGLNAVSFFGTHFEGNGSDGTEQIFLQAVNNGRLRNINFYGVRFDWGGTTPQPHHIETEDGPGTIQKVSFTDCFANGKVIDEGALTGVRPLFRGHEQNDAENIPADGLFEEPCLILAESSLQPGDALALGDVIATVRSEVQLGLSPVGSEAVLFDLSTLPAGTYAVIAEIWYGGGTTDVQYRGLYLYQGSADNTGKLSAILASDAPGTNDGAINVTGMTVKCGWGGTRSGSIRTIRLR